MANSVEEDYLPSSIPRFILVGPASDTPPSLGDAWREAIKKHVADLPALSFIVHEAKLENIDPNFLKNDCMAIPTNSYGIMDGGYDSAVSEALKGTGSEWSLSDHCQQFLMETWNGYAPPGTCTIVPLPGDMLGNRWDARYVALMPTMRNGESLDWHHDLVYNAMWALLSAISNWNKVHTRGRINSVLMTGLGTGAGGIPAEKCAHQMMLAVRHFRQGLPSNIRWRDVRSRNREIQNTITLGRKDYEDSD